MVLQSEGVQFLNLINCFNTKKNKKNKEVNSVKQSRGKSVESTALHENSIEVTFSDVFESKGQENLVTADTIQETVPDPFTEECAVEVIDLVEHFNLVPYKKFGELRVKPMSCFSFQDNGHQYHIAPNAEDEHRYIVIIFRGDNPRNFGYFEFGVASSLPYRDMFLGFNGIMKSVKGNMMLGSVSDKWVYNKNKSEELYTQRSLSFGPFLKNEEKYTKFANLVDVRKDGGPKSTGPFTEECPNAFKWEVESYNSSWESNKFGILKVDFSKQCFSFNTDGREYVVVSGVHNDIADGGDPKDAYIIFRPTKGREKKAKLFVSHDIKHSMGGNSSEMAFRPIGVDTSNQDLVISHKNMGKLGKFINGNPFVEPCPNAFIKLFANSSKYGIDPDGCFSVQNGMNNHGYYIAENTKNRNAVSERYIIVGGNLDANPSSYGTADSISIEDNLIKFNTVTSIFNTELPPNQLIVTSTDITNFRNYSRKQKKT